MQDRGSLLLAGNDTEAEQLEERAAALKAAGLSAELLDASSLRHREPALDVHPGMTGLLLQSDAQVVWNLAFSSPLIPSSPLKCRPFPSSGRNDTM